MGHRQLVGLLALAALSGCTGSGEPTAASSSPAATGKPAPIAASVFGDGPHRWRIMHGKSDDLFSWDDTLGPGAYELQIACEGGTMRVWNNHSPKVTIRCTGEVQRVRYCNTSKRLISHAEWVDEPHWDYAWQMVKRGDVCTPIDPGDA